MQCNPTQLGLARSAANCNRGMPVRTEAEVLGTNEDPKIDADGNPIKTIWVDQIEPFLEEENKELSNCPEDFQAENLPPVLMAVEVAEYESIHHWKNRLINPVNQF